jgi:hypothetical protein
VIVAARAAAQEKPFALVVKEALEAEALRDLRAEIKNGDPAGPADAAESPLP